LRRNCAQALIELQATLASLCFFSEIPDWLAPVGVSF